MEEFGDVVSVTYCDTDELVSDFGRLMDGAWRDGLSDVVLEDEGGTQLEGHGLMLRARSEYLAVALEERWGGWNPGARRPGRLVKPAASRESLLAVVRFIYTAYVIFTDENVYDIMLLAREMLVWDLVVLGREYVRSRLQISSAGFHAERCGLSGDEELQEAVAEYFVLEGEKILTSRGFLNYTRSQLEAVLSHENLGIDEDIVLLAAQNWSEVYCNFDREEAKKVLADLIASKLVRCLSLSSEAFDTLEENGLIPSEQAYLRFMYKAVLVNGRRYSIQSSFFRPSIRCSYVVTESKHPFLKTTFRRIIKLNKAADAIYIEIDSGTELGEGWDLVWTSPRSGEVLARLKDFKFPRSIKAFTVPSYRVTVKLERVGLPSDRISAMHEPCWGFRFICYAVITGKRWRRRNK